MGTPTLSPGSAAASVTSQVECDVRVLVIDDRYDRRQLMGYVVEQGGADMSVIGYADGPVSAVEAVNRLNANAVILEIQLPIAQGLDTISALREDFPALRIVVCSFHHDATTKRSALARGADAYLVKPLSPRDLHQLLRRLRPSGLGQTIRDMARSSVTCRRRSRRTIRNRLAQHRLGPPACSGEVTMSEPSEPNNSAVFWVARQGTSP